MNNDRRKELASIKEEIDKARGIIDTCRDRLETCKDDEQEYYDNMPESFQNGEKGDLATTAIEAIEEAIDGLEQIDLDAVDGSIDTACE